MLAWEVVRSKWFTKRAVKLHLLSLVAVGVCLALGYWQLTRALYDHNELSWGYTFEWPIFAGYAAWMWWKLLHEEPEFAKKKGSEEQEEGGSSRAPADAVQGPAAAYEDHLAGLDAGDARQPE